MAKLPSLDNNPIRDKYTVQNETLLNTPKSNPKDRIEVEIGDVKQPDFKPQAKIMRWDNEVNFSLRAEEHPAATVEVEGNVIKYKTPDYEVHQYELDPDEVYEDGGLEFEWILPKKPKTNVLTATIQTKGLNFFYQPALTQKEIDEGAERPENIVGSYAVYHKTKGGLNDKAGMEYKAGKAFQIPKPKITDANGDTVWGELNIDEQNGLLTVTIDQTWLDNATYPVIVDPTIGYTTIGGSSSSVSLDDAIVKSGTVIYRSYDIDKIYVYGSNASSNMKVLAFEYTGTSTGTLLTDGVGSPTAISSSAAWNSTTYSSKPRLSSEDRAWVGAVTDGGITYYYDSGSTGDGGYNSFYSSYATPSNLTSLNFSDRLMSIYADYTGVGGYQQVVSVAASSDDGFTYDLGSSFITGANMRWGFRSGGSFGDCFGGMRFLNIQIPASATVSSAILNYNANDTDASTDNVTIYAEDADDPVTFDTSTNTPKSRTTTTASTNWTLPNQVHDTRYDSPDFSSVIQEVVDRGGWAASQAMVVLILNNGATENHNISQYDDAASRAARLTLNWYTSTQYTFNSLVVAGGGGGGGGDTTFGAGGGGGAGGYQADSALILDESTAYTITVGAGGSGGTSSATPTAGSDGNNSSIGAALVATAGGGGGAAGVGATSDGRTGGSGGGGGYDSGGSTGGTGTAGEGNDGGDGPGSNLDGAAGGGGAGAVGSDQDGGGDGRPGGAGTASSITGSSVTRAGGGGGAGSAFGTTTGGAGGTGGGGAGGGNDAAGSNATANTGGGGGGGSANDGGNGGSGVVILRFPTSAITVVTKTGASETTDGADTILTWNSNGTFEFTVGAATGTASLRQLIGHGQGTR